MKKLLMTLMMSAVGMLGVVPAYAADAYPSQPVKLIVPFPPGGPTDGMARRLAEAIAKPLGQPVIVENKAGAGGNIGSEYVANAKPDGYTILFGTSGPLAINVSLYKKLGYDPRTSFAPIARIGHLPNILVLNPKVPASNLKELIAYAKAHPDTLSFASSGNGASSHLAGVLFNDMAGTNILHVPYRGTGPALNDLLGGQVSMAFTDIMTALPHVNNGTLRAIGLASAQRSAALPDLPTLAEQGLTGYDVSVFFGIVAPAGTPAPVIEKLNAAFSQAMSDPNVKATLESQGIVQAEDKSPEGLATFINSEVDKWATVIQNAKLSLD
ncbi:Bug family tripartite tricarboxylate transporter substrate binding protein [Allopusillimonas ginsengisoli]|uniref:Bug family tripartite tricarboxylate transporter substrate binding protein n=1 Tax=Allopusillimonas ginsengisoli TaxID=453575 RepID=UPI001020FD42|nr:tripartite tricarboxylate transporter substrate binding protein [Allopusillimonas ginsengisoli]TEA76845.1 tripartite tricarboxylate transporter substrate binding protein [Allopusillimonas ginsengisoli]